MSAWLDALLGRISNQGVALPLSKGVNASTGIVATMNTTTKMIDLTQDVPTVAASVIGSFPLASETVVGKVELANGTEANALVDTTRAVSPGRIPVGSETQRGVVELADAAETNALADTTRAVSPGRIPIASATQQGLIEIATAGEIETGLDATRAVTPANQHFHQSASKAWARWTVAGVIEDSYNVSGIVDGGVGIMQAAFATDFTNASAVVVPLHVSGAVATAPGSVAATRHVATPSILATTVDFIAYDGNGALADLGRYGFIAFGDFT